MNYLDIFGKKVQKFAVPAGTLDYTQYLGDNFVGLDQWKLSTPKSHAKPELPEIPEDSPSEFGPMGSKFDFSSDAVRDVRQQQLDALQSNDQQAFLNTLSADQAAAATGGNKPIDINLGGKTTKFDWKNSGVPWEMIGDVASAGLNAIDQATMGDKNFNAESQALDAAADGAAKMASKFGPWGLLAAGVIQTVNKGSKMLGGSVGGYNVGDIGSGYGNLGSMEQQSGRLKDRLSGKTARDLKRRNEQAQLALKAKDIVDDVKFEQEARMNSVDNVIQRNQIALSGGINTSMLAAKKGGKLQRLNKFITKAQYGAKLKKVEVSEEPNLLPEGELHKNKHDDFDLPVTKKGIPVITVENGAEINTIIDLQENKEDIQQHAEIERSEVIFSKELTDYIEEARKKWHNGDDSVLLEVGKRVTKELLQNTQDNTGLIRQLKDIE